MRRSLRFLALLAIVPAALEAQGALGVQGYGYPTGQIGSATLALGGATAEIDPASALNPAALGLPTRYAVYLQFEPEYRRTTLSGSSATSSTMRFPAFMISGGSGKWTGGVSATTLLDRTWTNIYADSQLIGGEMLPSTLSASSNGAITDARFAVAYWLSPKVQLGLGAHALTGENRMTFGRSFPDSTGIGSIQQLSTINYSGRALSMGVILTPTKSIAIGASMRTGGSLNARRDEAPMADAPMPTRFGVTVAYTGVPNTTVSARFDHTGWASLGDLGTAQMSVFDANDIGAGLEVLGPRIAGAPSYARLGLRDRTLPFGINGEKVGERSFTGGIALPLARGRGQIDLSLSRATRSAAGADEKSWFVSIGLGIRP